MSEDRTQKKILEAVTSLARYEIDVWNKVGPGVQTALVDRICAMSPKERVVSREIVMAVARAVLSPEMAGTTWHAESVTLRTGSVPAVQEVRDIRTRIIGVLFELFKQAANDNERREVVRTLREAGHSGGRTEVSDDFLILTLADSTKIVSFLVDEAAPLSLELMETLEHEYWYDYRRAKGIASAPARLKCKEAATELIAAIRRLRDKFNEDPAFVKFKVLVGFESVFPPQWSGDEDAEERFESEYEIGEKYRIEQMAKYISQIDDHNQQEWFALIERVASVESDDLATFPPFIRFLTDLSTAKPRVATHLLGHGSERVARFLPAILAGLANSNESNLYQQEVQRIIQEGKQLGALVRHLRHSKSVSPSIAALALGKAIEVQDNIGVMECLILAIEASPQQVPPKEDFYEVAINYLNNRKEFRWLQAIWLPRDARGFFESVTEEQARLLLPALVEAPKVNHAVERVLVQIAKRHPALAWECFAARLAREAQGREGGIRDREKYEAVPYRFHGLEKELSKHPHLAVEYGRSIFANDSYLFRFRGGSLLSAAFPTFPRDFSVELEKVISEGNESGAEFVLGVMENYHGEEQTHELLKSIVARFPNDDRVRTGVIISIEGTGAVWGENGFVNALRGKLEIVRGWLSDPRPEVRKFAEGLIKSIELRIVEEVRRAEEHKVLRKLQYDDAGHGSEQETNDDEGEQS